MLETITVKPVDWGTPLTDFFNNDIIRPLPRYINVWQESEEVRIPVYIVHVSKGWKRKDTPTVARIRQLIDMKESKEGLSL